MTRINWLHLSDLQMGTKGSRLHEPEVREEIERDLRQLHPVAGPWDLVIITGDISDTGSMRELLVVKEWLDSLLLYLGTLGSTPLLLAVPGNHDADWSARSNSPNASKRTAEAFKAFEVWYSQHPRPPALYRHTPNVPGNFVRVLEKEGHRLGVLGLNSAHEQIGPDREDTRPPSVDTLFAQRALELEVGEDPWLVLTHHPPSRLREDSRNELEALMKGRALLHLCSKAHAETSPKGARQFAGRAFLGRWAERSAGLGYCAGSVDFGEEHFILWPRTFTRFGGGGLVASPDPAFALEADGSMRIPWRGAAIAPSPKIARSPGWASPQQRGVDLRRSLAAGRERAVWLAWSPDGSRLASGHADGTVNVWDPVTSAVIWSEKRHESAVVDVAWSPDGLSIASISTDCLLVWNAGTGGIHFDVPGASGYAVAWHSSSRALTWRSNDDTIRELFVQRHVRVLGQGQAFAWSPDGLRIAIADGRKLEIRYDDATPLELLNTTPTMTLDLAWMPGSDTVASAHADGSIRIWSTAPDRVGLIVALAGHTHAVTSLSFSRDGRLLASKSRDNTVRLWRTDLWETVAKFDEETSHEIFGGLAFSPTDPVLATLGGWNIRLWDIDVDALLDGAPPPRTVHSTSAKVVLVGEGSAGKSCIAMRLVEDRYEELSSTHGMRFWPMPSQRLDDAEALPDGEEREVVLWDLGGQSEYRIIHQLFLDETTVALMVVEPRRGRPALDEIEEWIKRLRVHEARRPVKKLLVGSKLDDESAPVDRPSIDEFVRRHGIDAYVETSAKAGSGIAGLRRAIARSIDWAALGRTSQPELFQRIRREIEQIAAHRVVLPLSELEHSLRERDPEGYDAEAVRAVVRQLALQGILADSRLADGTRTLVLRVDHIDRYAGALIVMARDNPGGIAAIDLAKLMSPSVKLPRIKDSDRLRRDQELVVLDCVIQLLLERGICIRHEGLLVFPFLFQPTEHDPGCHHTVALYYEYSGAVDNIYASLVTSLAISRQFGPVRLWADRAEFSRAGQGTAGVRKSQRSGGGPGGTARLDVYFDDGAADFTRELFVGFVEDHLRAHGVDILERLTMICGGCGFELQEPVVRARREKGFPDILCSMCETRSPLTFGASEALERSPDLARRIQALKTTTEDRRRETIAETTVSMNQMQQSQAVNAGSPEPPIRVLHLSDLHVTADADPAALLQPLAADLEDSVDGLGIEKLDFLVVSGDITNRATAAEFEKAHELVSGIIDRFGLTAERCIIVPGNHDLDWNEPVYSTVKKRSVDPKTLKPGRFKEQGDLYEIRDDERYPNRFRGFSQYFYHPLRQKPYPLPSEQQCIPILSEELGVQFLAMNSAWEIDEYFRDRSGIHPGALSRGLAEADEQLKRAREKGSLGKGKQVTRIAVWHHPVTGNEKIENDAFMGHLQKAGVRLCLHGHVHEDRADLIGYLHPTRRVHVAGAGSFGAPAPDRPESMPRLYNVVEISRSSPSIRVHTRCLKKQTGAWEGWAVWPGSRPGEKRTYYEVDLAKA